MEKKYTQIYEEMVNSTRDSLENRNTEKLIEEFKIMVRQKVKTIHEKLEEKKKELIEKALEAFDKEMNHVPTEEEIEIKKKVASKKKKEVVDPESFKGKINVLTNSLDEVLNKTQSIEEIVNDFKTKDINRLVSVKDDQFNFFSYKRVESLLKGKLFWNLGWAETQNKPTYSNTNKEDPLILDVHATSCYNYYATDKVFEEDSVSVTFETNINKSDGYFYFGVSNNSNNYNNNCMCCTPTNCTYIKSTGNICVNGSNTTNEKLRFMENLNTITIRFDGKEKQVYFTVNDYEEQGPYNISGNQFTIVSGSCNTANGYIKILSSYIV